MIRAYSYMHQGMLWISIAFVVHTIVASSTEASKVIVDAPFGKIQGLKRTDEATGHLYVTFKGIPYAKPPLGELRFAKPQPHPKLDSVFDGTLEKRINCIHPAALTFGETEFTEDCLILNIHSKDNDPSNQSMRKVFVFIHGGGFLAGSSSAINTKSFVIREDVIVVTINYRLGILGFLSTENEASPGNYGLWDQTLALKWVKDNIRAFGGDPDDVTIAGESAGGASVGYQMISPHSKGLFTKAYPQSGTSTSAFALSFDSLALTLQVAKRLQCWNKDVHERISLEESNEIIQCLKQLPASEFAPVTDISFGRTSFVPVVDGDFISDSPRNLIKDDAYLDSVGFFDRSYLVALDNNEGGFFTGFFEQIRNAIFSSNETTLKEKESTWSGMIKDGNRMNIRSILGEKDSKDQRILDAIDDFYDRRYADDLTASIEMMVDLNFMIPSMDFLLAASRRPDCDAFLLYFDHFPDFMTGAQRGTVHGADLMYWLDVQPAEMTKLIYVAMEGEMSDNELNLKSMFSTVIGNFIKSGNPGRDLKINWPKFDVENSYYLNFNKKPWVSNFLEKDKQDFWLGTIPQMLTEQHATHEEL